MRFFDSHCHIEDRRAYGKDLAEVLERAKKAGVAAMMVVGTTLERSKAALELAEKYPGIFASLGVHPHDASACSEEVMASLVKLSQNPKIRAWGECGLDFNRMHSPAKTQEKWLEVQLETAVNCGLPLIFHERDSEGRLLEILKSFARGKNFSGVVHCFSGTREEMKAYLDLGLHIGITGILTHKQRGEDLREMVLFLPEDRMLIETDAPYLTPSPERNQFKRNEPAFVPRVLEKLAEVLKKNPEELAEKIFRNTCDLYRIAAKEIP